MCVCSYQYKKKHNLCSHSKLVRVHQIYYTWIGFHLLPYLNNFEAKMQLKSKRIVQSEQRTVQIYTNSNVGKTRATLAGKNY